jgi:hypothetical protein
LLLETAGVDYVVIGAMAASVHGVIRASTDADALAFLTVQRAKELERQFRTAGYEYPACWQSRMPTAIESTF